MQNHPVERMWVEINGRVNYPVKATLIRMEENGEINMESSMQKFCVSWFSIRVCSIGTKLAVQAWNEPPITGLSRSLLMYCSNFTVGHRQGGRPTHIPNRAMSTNNQVAKIDPHLIPTAHQAIRSFQGDGGHITRFSLFGEDPLASNDALVHQRNIEFNQRYHSFGPFFYQILNGNDSLFREGLQFFICSTQRLSQL